jgi:hypothetical protein
MPLPPLRHPAWMMVSIIACAGAALTSWMGGSATLPLVFGALAVVLALALAIRIRRA